MHMKIRKIFTDNKYPLILTSGKHPMNNTMIERRIVDVARRLSRNGYKAYFVGGCVRDIFLGKKPKDFDIATDAHPRQIKRLFSRCYLIGRRFRLAHVYITEDRFIEVATFRATVDPEEAQTAGFNANNVFGSIEEDALRRDFTINGLYYDPNDSSVIDYTGGFKDIENKIIRSIGDPNVRFQEDPVRMIRAARFCAQLGFRLSKNDYKAAVAKASLIETANQNRLLEELYKILRCGSSAETIAYLRRFKLLPYWIPQLTDEKIHPSLLRRLKILDLHRFTGEEIPNCVLLSTLFYDLFIPYLDNIRASANIQDAFIAIRDNFHSLSQHLRLPRNEWNNVCNIVARQIILSQPVSGKARTRGESKFIINHHFNDSLILFSILCEAENNNEAELAYWKQRATSIPKLDIKTIHPAPDAGRPHAGRSDKLPSAAVPDTETTADGSNGEVRKKKRRRRRR